MNEIKSVIFDMDGVIVDSEMIHVMAENYVLNKYGVYPTEGEWASFKGKTSEGIFASVIKEHGLSSVTAERLAMEKIDKFIEMICVADLKLFVGLIDLLNYLTTKYQLALATSSHSRIQKVVFDRFQLHKYFSTVVTGEMVKSGKPDPEPYLLAISKMGTSPESCIVIEDSVNGILSAKSAGARVVAVTHTFPREKLLGADYIVDSLMDVTKIIS